ncbi:MucBP domain-containing protein [Lactiplantibacillus modestisalitolerans]|uniref:MucBP domain-containing protein n=1 Tax=Lactiplantibacillus modestisalitolerans TaxID=1457219 RepID=A0ABV5WRE9_9LACO|nr:MucBP domain-containing protein [Lactiplantibacillus modestisalitolerans]
MRLEKLQQIQTISQHYLKKPGIRSWAATLIILAGSAGLGTTLYSQPAHASTTSTVTQTVTAPTSGTSTTMTSAALSGATSAATTATTSSTAVPATTSTSTTSTGSTAPTSTTTSTASMAPTSSATTATTSTASTAPTSSAAATSTTSSVTTSSTITITNPTSTGSTATSSSAATTTSSTGSTSTASSAAGSATSAGSTATSGATTGTTTTPISALPNSTVVTFGDSGIESAVQTGLGITTPVTLGDIRNYSGSLPLAIGTDNTPLQLTGTLDGMQYLQCLPTTKTISLVIQSAAKSIDFTPLIPDRFSNLSIMDRYLGSLDLSPLTQISPTTITELQLVGSSSVGGDTEYQTNPYGMTNTQLAQLGPWLTAIDATGHANSYNFDDNSLTNFGPLKNFTKPTYIVAIGQRVNLNVAPTNFIIGQPGQFFATPIVDVQGNTISNKYATTLNGATANATAPTDSPLTMIYPGVYEIPTAYPSSTDPDWFEYGFHGMYPYTGNPADFLNINYVNGTTFRYDVRVYQPATWAKAPVVYLNYVDAASGLAIAPKTAMTGTSVNEAFDFTNDIKSPSDAYVFNPSESSALTGTYLQDPQNLTLSFDRRATNTVTINYLDESGNQIAPSKTLTGYVGDAYSAYPLTITGYTYDQSTVGSAPAIGTYGSTPLTITDVYNPISLERNVVYYDDITQTTLRTDHLSGTYAGTTTYSPTSIIAGYVAKGYLLVSNDFPTADQVFTDLTTPETYTIHLMHQLETLTPTSTDLPSGVQLTRNVTATIQYETTNGTTVAPSQVETVAFTRDAERDLVTGAITYGAWVPVNGTSFASLTAPTISGYSASLTSTEPVTGVTANTPDSTVTVRYAPLPTTGKVTVNYVLAGTTIAVHPATELSGTTATDYQAVAPTIAGYTLVPETTPVLTGQYTAQPQTVTFSYLPIPTSTGATQADTPSDAAGSSIPTGSAATEPVVTPTASSTLPAPLAGTHTLTGSTATPAPASTSVTLSRTSTSGAASVTGHATVSAGGQQISASATASTTGATSATSSSSLTGSTEAPATPISATVTGTPTPLRAPKSSSTPATTSHQLPQTNTNQSAEHATTLLGLLMLAFTTLLGWGKRWLPGRHS